MGRKKLSLEPRTCRYLLRSPVAQSVTATHAQWATSRYLHQIMTRSVDYELPSVGAERLLVPTMSGVINTVDASAAAQRPKGKFKILTGLANFD